MGSAGRAARKPLRGAELLAVFGAVAAAYGGALYGLHRRVEAEAAADAVSAQAADERGPPRLNYWGTLPSAWDHPEPNYLVSPAVGEFWSVVTAVPVAGAMLLYEGFKYGYGAKVLRIYVLTCMMYSLAFSAHLTLQMHIFSATVTAVMSNALLTFAEFSGVVHRILRSACVRGAVVLSAEALLVFTVATLPYTLPANGGVWTLLVVQAPGVLLATAISAALVCRSSVKEEKTTYKTVFAAGCLLSSAMGLSLVECLYGFEHGFLSEWWGFPWLHVAIHVFEQAGIYIFGVGVASLHELLFRPRPREGAEVRYVCLCVPYLYCPGPPGVHAETSEPLAKDAQAEPTKEQARGRPREVKRPAAVDQPAGGGAGEATLPAGPPGIARANSFESDESPRVHPTLNKRRRDKTPGVLPVAAKPTTQQQQQSTESTQST